MAVSDSYRDFVLEQLARVGEVSARAMFGGVGIYSGEVFFALISRDVLYFRVNDRTRARYEDAGAAQFIASGNRGQAMPYFEVPPDILEDTDALREWMDEAIAAAMAAKR